MSNLVDHCNEIERNAIIFELNIMEGGQAALHRSFAHVRAAAEGDGPNTDQSTSRCYDILSNWSFSDSLYHSFMSFECQKECMVFTDSIDDFATLPAYTKSQSVYDTMIKVFLNARSPSSQKGMQHHVVMNGCTQTVPGFSDGQNMEYAHTMHLQTEDQNS